MNKKAILLIDSPGPIAYLTKRCQKLAYQLILLSTIKRQGTYRKHQNLPLYATLITQGDVTADIIQIRGITGVEIIAGMYGNEASVPYADKILSRLFPKASNTPKTSLLRHDKFCSNAALHEHGLPSLAQIKLNRSLSIEQKIEQSRTFFERHQKNIVIKPSSGSAASVAVYSPSHLSDISAYFQQAHAGLFFQSDTVLQEKISGQEYYIDVASHQGKHIITGIGQYTKSTTGNFEYQYATHISLDNPITEKLKRYILYCLSVLGMDNGLSHIEVMVTHDQIFLIDFNPRISGAKGFCNMMAMEETGADQIEAYHCLLSHKNLTLFGKEQYQRIFFFKNRKGPYQAVDLTKIQQLLTYSKHEIVCPHSNNTFAPSTGDLTAIVMYILLVSETAEQLEQDTAQLLLLEKNGDCLK